MLGGRFRLGHAGEKGGLRMTRQLLALAATAILLTACNFNAFTSKSDPTLNAEAERNYADLVAGRDDVVVARLSSKNDVAQVKAQLPMLRNLAGEGQPPAAQVTGTQSIVSNAGHAYRVAQRYEYADRAVDVQTGFVKEGEIWKIEGFHLNATLKAAPAVAVPAA